MSYNQKEIVFTITNMGGAVKKITMLNKVMSCLVILSFIATGNVYSDQDALRVPMDGSTLEKIAKFLRNESLELTPQRIKEDMPKELIASDDLMLSMLRGAVYFELTEYYRLNKAKALKKAKALVRSTVGDERELGAGKEMISVSFGGTQIRACYTNNQDERTHQESTSWKKETNRLSNQLGKEDIVKVLFNLISGVIDKAGAEKVQGVQIGLPGQPDATGKIACDDGQNPQLPAIYKFALGTELEKKLKELYNRNMPVILKNDCTLGTEYELSEKGTFEGKYKSGGTFLVGSGLNIQGVEGDSVFTGKGAYESVMVEPGHKITADLGNFDPMASHFTSRLVEWKGDKFPSKGDIDEKYLRFEAAIQGSALNRFAKRYGYYVPTEGDNNETGLPDLTEVARQGDENAREVIELYSIIAAKGYAAFIATGDNIDSECFDHVALISTVFQKLGKGVGFASNASAEFTTPARRMSEIDILIECDWLLKFEQKVDAERRVKALKSIADIREGVNALINREAYPGIYNKLTEYISIISNILENNTTRIGNPDFRRFQKSLNNFKNVFEAWRKISKSSKSDSKEDTLKWLLKKIMSYRPNPVISKGKKALRIGVFDKDLEL